MSACLCRAAVKRKFVYFLACWSLTLVQREDFAFPAEKRTADGHRPLQIFAAQLLQISHWWAWMVPTMEKKELFGPVLKDMSH